MFHVFHLLPPSAPESMSWANSLSPGSAPHSRMSAHPGETCGIPEFCTWSLHTVMRAGGRRRQNGEQRNTASRINQPWASQITAFFKYSIGSNTSSSLPTFWPASVCLLTVMFALLHSLRWARVAGIYQLSGISWIPDTLAPSQRQDVRERKFDLVCVKQCSYFLGNMISNNGMYMLTTALLQALK